MSEKLSGIIAEAEFFRPTLEVLKPGVILRPIKDWCEPIVVGKDIKLMLSNGCSYQTEVLGLEIINEHSQGILVKDIPGVANESLLGAKLYVIAE